MPSSRAPILHILRSELKAALQIGLSAVKPAPPFMPTAPERAGQPVVFVHGYLAHSIVFTPLKRALSQRGWTDLHTCDYPSTRLTLEQITDHVAALVKTQAKEKKVVLVGHSLGAVACRAFLKTREGDRWVAHFISLAGPHSGTSLYRLVPPWLQPALHPRGPWVNRLSGGPEPVPTTVIRARLDHQVFPASRASIPNAHELILENYGHNSLLVAPEAADEIDRILDALIR